MSKAVVNMVLNPITRERYSCVIPGEGRLSDHMVTPDGAIIYKNGHPYNDEELFPNDLINIVIVPKGGDTGKDIARTGIILAAQIGAAALFPGAGIGALAIRAGISVAATFGAYHLIQPPTPEVAPGQSQEKFTRLGSLTGSRNQFRPYGTIPRVYGRRRLYPPMSARPYTEVEGNNQYQRVMFAIGDGPVQLSKPRIGDTIIGSFDANNAFTSNDTFSNVEIEVGESPDLYSSQVEQTNPGATLDEDGEAVIRTTAPDADEIGLDITFTQGLFAVDANGNTIPNLVQFKFEYREVGDTSWVQVDNSLELFTERSSSLAYLTTGLWRARSSRRETLRVSKSWKVPSGQYEVRVSRIESLDFDDDVQDFSSCSWSALKSITYEKPTNLPGVVQLAMRVKATDQINGVLDNFSVEVKSRLPYYDGIEWQEVTFNPATGNGTGGKLTSNPAWIMADILTGGQNARPLEYSRINASEFKDFADNCEAEGRMCNIVLDGQRPLREVLNLIGSTGRGSVALHDELYTIVQDDEKETPVQHFTSRNSWDFSSTRTFPEIPHALRINFVNPDADWETDEVTVYDDDYSFDGEKFDGGFGTCALGSEGACKEATKFETLDLEGVTSADQAWKEGRYRLAEARLRPEKYTFMVDCENLVCQRGDLVYATHDVPLWGLKAGRIKSIESNILNLDEEVTIEAGKSYTLRVRNKSGVSVTKGVLTNATTTDRITVNNVTDIEPGDLFMFGEVGKETTPLKVLSIEPQGDLSARITAIDSAPDIYDADQGSIPEFNSNISVPPVDPQTIPPPPPTITSIRSDQSSLYTGITRIPILRLMVAYRVGSGSPTETIDAEFRKVGDDEGWVSFAQSSPAIGVVLLNSVERGEQYVVRIRARRGSLTSLWVQSDTHTAGGDIKFPGRPDNAIGSIVDDLDGTYTSINVDLLMKARKGVDFNIKDELENELIAITPTRDTGPGKVVMPIEEQFIEAPSGSYIIKSAHQEEGESVDVPGFDFVSDTLAVIGDELTASMDLIADGVDYARVAKSSLNAAGEVIVESFDGTMDEIADGVNYARVAKSALTAAGLVLVDSLNGTLDDLADGAAYARVAENAVNASGLVLVDILEGTIDDLDDGTTYARVKTSSLTNDGLVLLDVAVGDLDDIDDGGTYARVDSASLNASGLVLLSGAVGDLDDIEDGTNFQRIASASLSASGLVLLSSADGTIDDIGDGSTFGRVDKASLSASGLVLLSSVSGTMDDLEDGDTYGRVNKTQIDSNGLIISSGGFSGDLDDIDDGTNFQRVASASLTASGLVILSATDGTLDDIDDGVTYGRIDRASLSASGLVLLSATQGSIDDLDDGSTYGRVNKSQLDSNGLVISSAGFSGDLDDINDGNIFGRVDITSLTSTGLVILSAVEGDIDDVDDGDTFGRVDKTSLNASGLVIVSGLTGDIDDLDDGAIYKRVQSASLTAGGLVLLSASVGTIDDIEDGDTYGRIDQASLTASGLVLISALSGDIDDLTDGDTFGKVKKASLTADGLVLLSGAEGDLGDIDDGDFYQKVQKAALTSGGLVFLAAASGDLDDIDNGDSFGKIQKSSLTASGLVIVEGLSGDIDDLDDGSTYQRVKSASLTAGGLVLLSAASGDMDDISDGDSYARVDRASLTPSGLVLLSGVSGDMDDLQDGSTYQRVRSSSLTASGLVIMSQIDGDIDDINDGSTYSRVLATEVSAGHIKIIGPDGQTVIDQGVINTDELFASEANITNILTMGANGEITNADGDFSITDSGIVIAPRESIFNTNLDRAITFEDQAGSPGAELQLIDDVLNNERFFTLTTNDQDFILRTNGLWKVEGLQTGSPTASGGYIYKDSNGFLKIT